MIFLVLNQVLNLVLDKDLVQGLVLDLVHDPVLSWDLVQDGNRKSLLTKIMALEKKLKLVQEGNERLLSEMLNENISLDDLVYIEWNRPIHYLDERQFFFRLLNVKRSS